MNGSTGSPGAESGYEPWAGGRPLYFAIGLGRPTPVTCSPLVEPSEAQQGEMWTPSWSFTRVLAERLGTDCQRVGPGFWSMRKSGLKWLDEQRPTDSSWPCPSRRVGPSSSNSSTAINTPSTWKRRPRLFQGPRSFQSGQRSRRAGDADPSSPEISEWAKASRRRWLIELLVPATREQLAQSEEQLNYDREVRLDLTVEAIRSFNDGGVHPTIWKLEGYETTQGAQEVLRAVAAETAWPAECIVLGRNAPIEHVEHWIDVAAPLPGFAGFAVGRSIWEDALKDLLAGNIERNRAVDVIADRYRRLIEEYCSAALPGASGSQSPEPFTWDNPRLTPDREERNAGH